VKRILILLSVATAVAMVGVTAPALSSRPYQPAPVEAEVAAPADGLGEARERGFVSEPVEAPMRFNMVGLNWNGGAEPGIALRVRKEGGTWSDWTTVPPQTDGAPDPRSDEGGTEAVSAPVWAGEADQVQYRVSRRPPDLRLHFINTTGTATAADRVETTLRGVVNEATVAVAGLASAEADGTAPAMMSRAEWSGGQCDPRGRPEMGKVKAAFIHHTVTANDYSRAQAPSMVLGICRYHRYSNGWDDIGYNFLVDKYGRLYEGRAGGIGRAVIGAQVQGFNDQSTGIANLGTHSSKRQSRRALRATARLLRWKLPHHGATTGGSVRLTSRGGSLNPYPNGQKVRLKRISGHRDAQRNECPGSALYGQLKRLRRMSDMKPPRPPEGLRATAGPQAVKLDWRRNTEKDLDGYSVYRKRAGGTWKQLADVRRSEFRHEGGRRPGRTLSYHVRAFDDRGNLSRPSREATVTVPRG
jgi:hypothetical protein